MSPMHIVRQGECLSSIAHHYKLASWRVIYDDPHNADFRAKRPNPNLIYPGDTLYIPNLRPHSEDIATDQLHTFVVKLSPTYVNIRVQDLDNQPIANAQFELKLSSTLTLADSTDDDGWIRSKIPAWAEIGTLKVWPNRGDQETVIEWETKLGHLDPIETTSGVKGRLNNLGYDCGEVNDMEDAAYTSAVTQFQTDYNLKVDGIVGPQTRSALLKAHRV